jgi:hypothetical protein
VDDLRDTRLHCTGLPPAGARVRVVYRSGAITAVSRVECRWLDGTGWVIANTLRPLSVNVIGWRRSA